jgi:hypothetical protein
MPTTSPLLRRKISESELLPRNWGEYRQRMFQIGKDVMNIEGVAVSEEVRAGLRRIFA